MSLLKEKRKPRYHKLDFVREQVHPPAFFFPSEQWYPPALTGRKRKEKNQRDVKYQERTGSIRTRPPKNLQWSLPCPAKHRSRHLHTLGPPRKAHISDICQSILGLALREVRRLTIFKRRGRGKDVDCVPMMGGAYEVILPRLSGYRGGLEGDEAMRHFIWAWRVARVLSNVVWTSSYSLLSSWASADVNVRRKLFVGEDDEIKGCVGRWTTMVDFVENVHFLLFFPCCGCILN